ncbi:MAG: hypothetical protein IPF44_10565 [Betaproteobacteria bacterium]|nr:hypothetical protein [Betaproteobacteria bacterium]
MKTIVQPVRLTPANAEGESRLIKSTALMAFRFLRTTIEAAKTVPGIVAEAASDVREAWEESSRPNA